MLLHENFELEFTRLFEADELNTEVSQDQGNELQELWDQNADSSTTYRPISSFEVKQVGDEYEVHKVIGDDRKLSEKLSKEELEAKYVPASTTTPDAEGFVAYVLKDNVEAFQYDGDATIIHNGTEHASLMKSDFIVKRQKGDGFEFMVVKQSEFESKYEEIV